MPMPPWKVQLERTIFEKSRQLSVPHLKWMLAVRRTQFVTVTFSVDDRSPIAPLALRHSESSIDSTKQFEMRTLLEDSGSIPSAHPLWISTPSITTSSHP